MVCNKCGYQLSRDASFCPQCGSKVKNSEKKHGFSEGDSEKRAAKVPWGLIIILTVVTIAVAAVIGVFVVVSNQIKSHIDDSEQEQISVQRIEKKPVEQVSEKEDEPEAEKEKEEVKAEDKAEDKAEAPEPDAEWNEAEEDFDFRFGATGIVTNPDYQMIYDNNYSFYCYVPSHFLKYETLGGVRYYAPDKTAVLDITAYINSANRTPKELLDARIAELGGEVTYSASGDTWFAVSIRKNGVSYYTKCFVDHYVREFRFNFPTEYEMYRDYVEYIEDHFKRTDQ